HRRRRRPVRALDLGRRTRRQSAGRGWLSTRSSWIQHYGAEPGQVGVVGDVTAVGLLLIAVRDELVWIDCEMTGLDLKSDRLIEIAVLVTDAALNILGDGLDVVIHAPDEALSGMI